MKDDDSEPFPSVHTQSVLSKNGEKIVSRLYLDQLNRVLAARMHNGLLLRPAFQWQTVA